MSQESDPTPALARRIASRGAFLMLRRPDDADVIRDYTEQAVRAVHEYERLAGRPCPTDAVHYPWHPRHVNITSDLRPDELLPDAGENVRRGRVLSGSGVASHGIMTA